MKYDVFISYRNGAGTHLAQSVYEHLKKAGLKPYECKREMHGGDEFPQALENAVKNCKVFVLILTPDVYTGFAERENTVDYVLKEIKTAMVYNKTIIPFVDGRTTTFAPEKFPGELQRVQTVKGKVRYLYEQHALIYHEDYDEPYGQLIRHIKDKIRSGRKWLLPVLLAGVVALALAATWLCKPENPAPSAETPGGIPQETGQPAETTQPPETTTPPETTVPQVLANHSRDTAWEMPVEDVVVAELTEGNADWYYFTTGSEPVSCSIWAAPHGESDYAYLHVELFSQIGIKLDETTVFHSDELCFLDLYLDTETTYYIKVYGASSSKTNQAGGYELALTPLVWDAGGDKENATEFTCGETVTGVIDSSLQDWYVCTVPEAGKYKITLHNMDVGERINLSVTSSGGSLGGSVKNDDNRSWYTNIAAGDRIYFEIQAENQATSYLANGSYMLVFEKVLE